MQHISIHASRSYEVVIDRGLLSGIGGEIREVSAAKTVTASAAGIDVTSIAAERKIAAAL